MSSISGYLFLPLIQIGYATLSMSFLYLFSRRAAAPPFLLFFFFSAIKQNRVHRRKRYTMAIRGDYVIRMVTDEQENS